MKIKRALLSVSDKTGIVEFAKKLNEAGVEIISTGGTMKAIKEAGIPVMLSDFGSACPATGFALGIERVMLALERQGQQCKTTEKNIYVAYGEGAVLRAIETVTSLRQSGKTTELALQAQSRKEAQAQCAARNCAELVFVD